MSIAKKGDTVKIHYQALSGSEILFDSARQLTPLQLTIGKEEIIPAFEKALIGMTEGDIKQIHLMAAQAFGPYLKELVTTIPKEQLPTDISFERGQHLQVQQPDGSVIIVKVIETSPQAVTFDANHPLAGKDLTFAIKLVEII